MTNAMEEDREPQPSCSDTQNIIGAAVGQAMAQMQEMIQKSGFLETASLLQEQLRQQESGLSQPGEFTNHISRDANQSELNNSQSEVTIYQRALIVGTKRNSSSSEEGQDLNIQDSLIELSELDPETQGRMHNFISDRGARGRSRTPVSAEREL